MALYDCIKSDCIKSDREAEWEGITGKVNKGVWMVEEYRLYEKQNSSERNV